MKTSLITFGAFLGLVSAQHAVVNNHCASTVYVQSFPYDGSAPGPLTTLLPGGNFTEKFRPSGSTVKIGKAKTLAKPLFFGYSLTSSPNYAYYEFSTEWGNPFAANANSLSPGEGCMAFDCAANDPACYSTPAHKKVYGCPRPVNLTADLCL
ncbi:hypothetical protein N7474_005432 [Penicillium riverlandense]|uniref:uncharacterized protein n=1 Tax=Penicillium riverlandense TaxID=1903569 RepID=UPI0025492B9C|nr:uncharacterized protein N7474_005432 [Penicillium riverlandense]KAJ5819841.1 hypothetical protein N7474_005432 [Penicillium riverlandense]